MSLDEVIDDPNRAAYREGPPNKAMQPTVTVLGCARHGYPRLIAEAFDAALDLWSLCPERLMEPPDVVSHDNKYVEGDPRSW